jgi:recombination protein RecT
MLLKELDSLIEKGEMTDEKWKEFFGDSWEHEKNRQMKAQEQKRDLQLAKTGLDKIKVYAEMEDVKKRFINLLGDRDGRAYVESVVIAVANNDSLQKCSPKSIMISAMRAASLRLSVDPIMKQAHLVPMGSEATIIVDYHGLVQLSVNTNYYEIPPNVFEVYEGENVKMERFSGKVEIEGERASDKVIGWCGYFKAKNGTERWLYMTNEECDAHGKKYSKAFNSPKSGWTTEREKMRRKTVLRLLVSRWGNFSPQVQSVIMQEEPAIDAEAFEMPSDDNIIVEEAPKRSKDEIMSELGYGE